MTYEYDVFLSYNRKFPHGQWVDDVFYPLFKPYLEDALNKNVSIFKDTEKIEGGSAWPQRLKNALVHSKCMVAVFSPSYFRSKWCMKEFTIMNFRQKQLGYLTLEKPNGLIIPINLFDGEHFPRYARDLQTLDCRGFNRVGDGIKSTKLYIDLQGILQKWVYDVAAAVNNAPEWDAAWKSKKWLETPIKNIQPENKTKVRKPNL
jgi:hypothetical protein